MAKTVIALTGPMAAGKGGLKQWAKAREIPYIELSELVEEHAGRPKEELGREGLQDFADAERRQHGADLYAREAAEQIDGSAGELVIVDGVRNPHECEHLRQRYDVLVIGIVPPSPDHQFENVKTRGRDGDPQTREEFERLRRRELGEGEDYAGQQVEACLQIADEVITNEGGEGDTAALVADFERILQERKVSV